MTDTNFKILIIEDEFFASQYLYTILEELGFKDIFISSSSKEAEEIVKLHKIHFAFVDINIKGSIDGIRCAVILNNYYFLPIIYTTAYEDSVTIQEAMQTNIFGYLIKPFKENLTKKELDILSFFIDNNNKNISYEILRNKIWEDKEISNSTIRDSISRLKKKIPEVIIKNIINFGYILNLGTT